MKAAYDLVIIGAGSAGLTAAGLAVRLGARVALLDKYRIGGDCTWDGCVPSKTLIKTAKVAYLMRHADRYNLTPVKAAVNMEAVMGHVRDVVSEVYQYETPETLRAAGIDVFQGNTRFLDAHTVAVGKATLTARHVLLATGAHPFIPPISGLDSVEYLTYRTFWDQDTLPRHMLVIGAGPIGCEMSQALSRLGAKVTLIEGGERMLPRDEPEASQALAEVFTDEGIDLRFNTKVERAWQDSRGIHLATSNGELTGDALLVTVGRRPNVDNLGLESAGVAYSRFGIQVNDRLRTSQRHIYAAGDCTGSFQFSHYAGWQAAKAVRNALFPGASRGVSERVPWATFTDPEVAHVGMTEEQARRQYGDAARTFKWSMKKTDRAQTEAETSGFIKVIFRSNGRLLGTTIVAAQAGEMINEWVLALEQGLKVAEMANTIHVYPTYSSASMQAAAEISISQASGGIKGKILRRLIRFRI